MESSPSSPAKFEDPGGDRAGSRYWDQMWEKGGLPPPLDPHRRGLKNYPFRKFHQFFESVFKSQDTRGKKLIEIGCAQSFFLPYFSKTCGFDVAGLDRSEMGCKKARQILQRESVAGAIYCADMFSPPPELFQQFDVLVSFGVVEHCENTAHALKALARLMRTGATMITTVPNLRGLPGALQKRLDRKVYDLHLAFTKEGFAQVHREAGLEVRRCEYLMPINLEVLNVESWGKGTSHWIAIRTHGLISRLVWLADGIVPIFKPNRLTSPYIACVSTKV